MRNPENFLLLASIGLLTLSFLGIQPPAKISTENISPADLGEKIRITGTVENSSSFEDTVFLTLSDKHGTVPVVFFSSNQVFSQGEKITVNGRLTMYEGELEIVADRIKRSS